MKNKKIANAMKLDIAFYCDYLYNIIIEIFDVNGFILILRFVILIKSGDKQ